MKRLVLVMATAGLILGSGGPAADASITIGQLAPGSSPFAGCGGPGDLVPGTVTSGTPYVMPETGRITSWSHNAGAGAGQQLIMRVFRHVSGPTWSAVSHDGPRNLDPGVLNTFPASAAVQAGDVLGLNTFNATAHATACLFTSPGDSYLFDGNSNLDDGQQGDFTEFPVNVRLNIAAVLEPDNSVALAEIRRNRKNGTASVVFDVPNPGSITASTDGAKLASITTRVLTRPGFASFRVRAKGRKRTKLNETGKVKLRLSVTYTPTAGKTGSQQFKVRLHKKH
jgi:hypothetical protein